MWSPDLRWPTPFDQPQVHRFAKFSPNSRDELWSSVLDDILRNSMWLEHIDDHVVSGL